MALADRNRLPLYHLVAEEVLRTIRAGEWAPNQQLPSELELAKLYAVSRATVREALRVLEQEGTVRARRGQGTFVAASGETVQVGVDTLYSLSDALQQQGHMPGTADLQVRTEPIAGVLAQTLQIDPAAGETAAVIERTRLSDGQPVVQSRDTVPLRYLSVPGWECRVATGSLFSLLAEAELDLSWARTQVKAVEASERVAACLTVRPGAPLLMISEVIFDRGGRPVACSEDYYRTDLIEVNLVRRGSSRGHADSPAGGESGAEQHGHRRRSSLRSQVQGK
jgi:GntR family transcriptional regulator